jgi:hypothetical protein
LSSAEKFIQSKVTEIKHLEEKLHSEKFLKYMIKLHGTHLVPDNEQYIRECNEYLEELSKKTLEVVIEESKLYNLNIDLAKFVALKNAEYYLQDGGKKPSIDFTALDK